MRIRQYEDGWHVFERVANQPRSDYTGTRPWRGYPSWRDVGKFRTRDEARAFVLLQEQEQRGDEALAA